MYRAADDAGAERHRQHAAVHSGARGADGGGGNPCCAAGLRGRPARAAGKAQGRAAHGAGLQLHPPPRQSGQQRQPGVLPALTLLRQTLGHSILHQPQTI